MKLKPEYIFLIALAVVLLFVYIRKRMGSNTVENDAPAGTGSTGTGSTGSGGGGGSTVPVNPTVTTPVNTLPPVTTPPSTTPNNPPATTPGPGTSIPIPAPAPSGTGGNTPGILNAPIPGGYNSPGAGTQAASSGAALLADDEDQVQTATGAQSYAYAVKP